MSSEHYVLQDIIQSFTGKPVLDIPHLTITRGTIYGLLGANGAGKTTLFHILAFLTLPKSGTMRFAGQPVSFTRRAMQSLRRRVVMVDQSPIMFSTSVAGNVGFGLKIRGISGQQRRDRIHEALEMVDLTRYASESAHALSGGETQRLALARALALRPEVLLCDEPTANVDAENQAVIKGLLARINREQGSTIIFTTHDRLQAAGLADRFIVLEKGRVVTTSYENIFSCSLVPCTGRGERDKAHEGSELCCYLQQKVLLRFPTECDLAQQHAEGKSLRVYFDPEKIHLQEVNSGVQGDPKQESSKKPGLLFGRIALLMAESDRVRITVDAGVMITVIIGQTEYQEQRWAIGDKVALQIAANAMQWV